jgi:hypothetical protein
VGGQVGTGGSRKTVWFNGVFWPNWCFRPGTATLFSYPATASGKPYVWAGRFEGYGFGTSTLTDLAAGRFLLTAYGADDRRLPPLPDGVRNVTPEAIGSIDLTKMTFSPEIFAPVYIE